MGKEKLGNGSSPGVFPTHEEICSKSGQLSPSSTTLRLLSRLPDPILLQVAVQDDQSDQLLTVHCTGNGNS